MKNSNLKNVFGALAVVGVALAIKKMAERKKTILKKEHLSVLQIKSEKSMMRNMLSWKEKSKKNSLQKDVAKDL